MPRRNQRVLQQRYWKRNNKDNAIDKSIDEKGDDDEICSKSTVPSNEESQQQKFETEKSEVNNRDDEWREMTSGIAILFDEAIHARRLLYPGGEVYQKQALDADELHSQAPYSELYGCEHLLRLLIRVPELLVEGVPEERNRRPILAKINDFVRYLHKNHEMFLTQSFRRLNNAEIQFQQKHLKLLDRKRKQQEQIVKIVDDGSIVDSNTTGIANDSELSSNKKVRRKSLK